MKFKTEKSEEPVSPEITIEVTSEKTEIKEDHSKRSEYFKERILKSLDIIRNELSYIGSVLDFINESSDENND